MGRSRKFVLTCDYSSAIGLVNAVSWLAKRCHVSKQIYDSFPPIRTSIQLLIERPSTVQQNCRTSHNEVIGFNFNRISKQTSLLTNKDLGTKYKESSVSGRSWIICLKKFQLSITRHSRTSVINTHSNFRRLIQNNINSAHQIRSRSQSLHFTKLNCPWRKNQIAHPTTTCTLMCCERNHITDSVWEVRAMTQFMSWTMELGQGLSSGTHFKEWV